jgi:hypothetical protein
VPVPVTALAGTIDRTPKPNADTATSAMRLIDVFVDICFLSKIVDPEDFPESAWRENAFSSDMSKVETRSYGMSAFFCAS